MISKVKWFNNKKGYGFIINPNINEEDIFIHYTDIEKDGYKTIKEGESVEFEIENTNRGLKAKHIHIIKDSQTIK